MKGLMPPRLIVKPGVWKHGDGERTEALKVYKVVRVNGRRSRFFVGVIPYDKARHFADVIHDACDEREQREREDCDFSEDVI